MPKHEFYKCCLDFSGAEVQNLISMIDNSIGISRKTFLKHVNKTSLEQISNHLGYEKYPQNGLTMAGDWHIHYCRSTLNGERVYYFIHSAIEYIFKKT